MSEASSESAAVVRGLFGRDSLYMILWAIQMILAAVLTPVITRLMGASRFGTVASAVAIMQFLVTVGGLSLQTSVQRAYAREGGETQARAIVGAAVVAALAIWAVSFGSAGLWASSLGFDGFSVPLKLAVCWASLTSITNASLGLIRSREQLAWFASVTFLQSVVAELVGLGLVAALHGTASDYLLGQMLAQAAAAALGLALTRPRLPRRSDAMLVRSAFAYGAGLVPAALSAFIFDASDRLIVQADLGHAAVGRYAVARNIGGLVILMLPVLQNAWMPRLFTVNDPHLQRSVLARTSDALYLLVGGSALALTAASPLILDLWVPSSYHPEGLLFVTAVIAVSGFAVAGGQSAIRALLLASKTFPIGVATLVAAAGNIGLNLLLIPWLGINGSALATAAAYMLLMALLHVTASRQLSIPRPRTYVVVSSVGIATACLSSTLLPDATWTIPIRSLAFVAGALLFVARITTLLWPDRTPARVHRLLTRSRHSHPQSRSSSGTAL